MAKTLGNATSHTLRRGHILGAEFAAVAQCRVIVITRRVPQIDIPFVPTSSPSDHGLV